MAESLADDGPMGCPQKINSELLDEDQVEEVLVVVEVTVIAQIPVNACEICG